MAKIWIQAGIYLAAMLLGYVLRRLGAFRLEDGRVFSSIIIYVTLPAVVVSSFGGVRVDFWFLAAFGLGLAANAVMVGVAFAASCRKKPEVRALYTINCPGYNLGNITIPFLQGFYPSGIPYLCMFDTTDSCFSPGATYAIACTRLGKKSGKIGRALAVGLLTSVPFDAYLLMMALSLLGVSLPGPITEFAGFLGKANGCLAMLMVGISLEFHLARDEVRDVVTILLLRYAGGALFALAIYFLIPAPLVMRQVLSLAVFSAVANIAMIYSSRLGVRAAIANAVNPIAIVLSILIMSAVMGMMG